MKSVKETLFAYARELYHRRVFIILFAFFFGLSYYAIFLAFGDQSFSVLARNQNIEKRLKYDIQKLQMQNTQIQKKLFEIKGLEP